MSLPLSLASLIQELRTASYSPALPRNLIMRLATDCGTAAPPFPPPIALVDLSVLAQTTTTSLSPPSSGGPLDWLEGLEFVCRRMEATRADDGWPCLALCLLSAPSPTRHAMIDRLLPPPGRKVSCRTAQSSSLALVKCLTRPQPHDMTQPSRPCVWWHMPAAAGGQQRLPVLPRLAHLHARSGTTTATLSRAVPPANHLALPCLSLVGCCCCWLAERRVRVGQPVDGPEGRPPHRLPAPRGQGRRHLLPAAAALQGTAAPHDAAWLDPSKYADLGGVGWWRCCDPQGGKKLTSEQQDIVMTEDRPQTSSNNKPKNQQQPEGPADQGQAAPEGEEPALLVVTAFAGTGKTTTLRAYAEARPDRRSATQAGCRQTRRQAGCRPVTGRHTHSCGGEGAFPAHRPSRLPGS